MVDSSSFVGTDGFDKSREFIKAVAQYFDFKATKFSLIDFAGDAKTLIAFNNPSKSMDELKALIDDIQYRGGKSHKLSSGLDLAMNSFNGIGKMKKRLVLITASQPTDDQNQEQSLVNVLKAQMESSGVDISVVGVGSGVTKDQITKLATRSIQAFTPPSYDDIFGAVVDLRKNICDEKQR